MIPVGTYKRSTNLDQRKEKSEALLKKNPARVPIICEVARGHNIILDQNKNKFMSPKDITMGEFMSVIRRRIQNLNAESALYLFINNKLIPLTENLGTIYNENKDPEDNFLYIILSLENTFGFSIMRY